MTKPKRQSSKKAKPGPKPERLIIDGDWKEAVVKALKRGKPATPSNSVREGE